MNNHKSSFTVKDYSVSGEIFELKENEKHGFLETYPLPDLDKISEYYKTEDYISHTDSKRNLFEKAYHIVRSIALKKKLKIINSFQTEEKNLLDIGCGTGDFLKTAKDHNWKVKGIEPNENARAISNSKTNNSVVDTERLNEFEKHSFDVITLWHVLEHLPNIEKQITDFKRLLKPNGVLIIAVPNYKSFDSNHYKEFWAAYDVPRHLWHFNKESIKSLFGKHKLNVVKIFPMKFDAFYVSLLSEKYKTGKMNPIKAFWVGLRSNLKAKTSGEYSSLIYCIKNS